MKRRALDEVHQLEEHRLSHMLMQPALATLRCRLGSTLWPAKINARLNFSFWLSNTVYKLILLFGTYRSNYRLNWQAVTVQYLLILEGLTTGCIT